MRNQSSVCILSYHKSTLGIYVFIYLLDTDTLTILTSIHTAKYIEYSHRFNYVKRLDIGRVLKIRTVHWFSDLIGFRAKLLSYRTQRT